MRRFSFMWSEALGEALREAAKEPFSMSLTGEDALAVAYCLSQGIDSYLEACNVPARGDSYAYGERTTRSGKLISACLECEVSPESLPVLVRRLLESGEENAWSLAGSICDGLGIELI